MFKDTRKDFLWRVQWQDGARSLREVYVVAKDIVTATDKAMSLNGGNTPTSVSRGHEVDVVSEDGW